MNWVQREIAKFGGDPDQVTLMGHSSGAWGVSLITMLDAATGLYKQAIAMSCLVVIYKVNSKKSFSVSSLLGFYEDNITSPSEAVARYVGCAGVDFDWSENNQNASQWLQMVNCMKSKSTKSLLFAQAAMTLAGNEPKFGQFCS